MHNRMHAEAAKMTMSLELTCTSRISFVIFFLSFSGPYVNLDLVLAEGVGQDCMMTQELPLLRLLS